jgi:hypothetical protein
MTEQQQQKLEDEINAQIEAGLAREMAKKREELAYQARRKIEMAHLDKVNARHPIEDKYGGLGKAGHEARLRAMSAAAAKANAEMDAVNQRAPEGSLVHQRSQASLTPGSEGFRFKQA